MDRPSQRPTIRAPMPMDALAPAAMPAADPTPSARPRHRPASGLVAGVAALCGGLLGAGAVLALIGPAPLPPVAARSAGALDVLPTAEPGSTAEHAPATVTNEAPRAAPPVTSNPARAQEAVRPATERSARARPRRTPSAPFEALEDDGAADAAIEAGRIRRIVATNTPRVRQCYTTALRRAGAPVTAHVRMTLDIDPRGLVRHVGVEGASIPGMGECLERTAARWTFPDSPEGTQLGLSFVFEPRGA